MFQFHAAKFDEVPNFVALPESDVGRLAYHRMQSHRVLVSMTRSRRLRKTGQRRSSIPPKKEVGFAQYAVRSMDITNTFSDDLHRSVGTLVRYLSNCDRPAELNLDMLRVSLLYSIGIPNCQSCHC